MPKTLFEHLSPDTGSKRILALDGGGVKGILTLGMLKGLEDELRRRAHGDAEFRPCDYYDLIGGTSTGAIIATAFGLSDTGADRPLSQAGAGRVRAQLRRRGARGRDRRR